MSYRAGLNVGSVSKFVTEQDGKVIFPEDSQYDAARRRHSATIDRYPAAIVRCTSVDDVVRAVRFARANNVEVAVRGGGHSLTGRSICDGGVVVDLSEMKSIVIDAEHRVATVQGGVVWRELDEAAGVYGLATTGGLVSDTGVAGLTFGGGVGNLMRKYGLACDNLVGAEIVLADGSIARASDHENVDLLWALRGGGGGLGVVTSVELRLHPVQDVTAGVILFPAEDAKRILQRYVQFCADEPDELYSMAKLLTVPVADPFPEQLRGETCVAIGVCWCGASGECNRLFDTIRSWGDMLLDTIGELPYARYQKTFDVMAPWGWYCYVKSNFFARISEDVLSTIVGQALELPTPESQITIMRMGGAISRVPSHATSFGHRDAQFLIGAEGFAVDSGDYPAARSWARRTMGALVDNSTGGTYLNFVSDQNVSQLDTIFLESAASRLAELKSRYDPEGVFGAK